MVEFIGVTKDWVLDRLPSAGTWRNRQFNVMDYGAMGDGVADDTTAIQSAINAAAAAGGGRVVLPATGSAYLVGGPLQDTGVNGANAQLLLPAVPYGSGTTQADQQITITIEGEIPAPITYSVVGEYLPLPDQHSIIKSTHTGTGNVIGGRHAGSHANFTNLLVDLRNFTVRMPSNPSGTAINLQKVAQARVDGVSVDAGNYTVFGPEPTNATSFALKLPGVDNGALTHVGSFAAIGFFHCVEIGEHTNVFEITSYGCKVGVLNASPGHFAHIQRLNVHHQPYGVRVTQKCRMDIACYNIEHSSDGSWRVRVWDVDDPSDLWYGQVRYGVGATSPAFNKNGGANVTTSNVGAL